MIDIRLYNDQEVGELEDELLADECRFCGKDGRPFVENEGRVFLEESQFSDEYWSAGPFQVYCEECGRRGPMMDTPEMAIRAWNKMPKRRRKEEA